MTAILAGCGTFKQECNIIKIWKIDNYEIVEKSCIGFAGPHYYPIYLYKDKKEIDYVIKKDSCIVMFNNQGKELQFDLCDRKIIKRD
ncbi:hypothetical protein [Flavobacterium nitrogenifigens]|uniref:hypothetical protein n=1 Tax=Flavobacterium nitrogenifigens TaxID=1617283 RepID=UPI0031ACCCEC